MNRPDRFFIRAPRSTASQQSAGRFIELGFQKELRERWVSLVSATVVQAYLCIAGQFQFARLAAVIDKRHRPHLGIGVRHDTNRPTRLDVAVQAAEFSLVSVKLAFVLISFAAQRLIAGGPDFVLSQVADVNELTPAIARHIFAPAADIKAPPRADSGPNGRNHNAVLAV